MLQEGESKILILSKVLYVHYIGKEQITGLFLAVKGTGSSTAIEKEFPLPLTQ
ncbi:MAG: hypothetical protein RDV48_18765 [Candidatus Eremiobacteraeota bacterium]|nr:hypothetical protein [Candidatus Eremiobacteraeota bacterium]